MEKKSFSISTSQASAGLALGAAALSAIGIAGYAIKSEINKINNDAQRKRMLEDISLNDPVLKNVDKSTLLGWYASMYHVAPTLTKDRNTVVETLRNFQRFGKVDMNTLKLLAETEKTVNGNKQGGFGAMMTRKFF